MRKGILVAIITVFVTIAIAAVFTGCGEDSGQVIEKVQSQFQENYGTEVQNLESALAELQNDSTYDSVDSLQAAFSDIESAFDDLVSAVEEGTGENISALENAFDSLKEDVSNISSDESLEENMDSLKAAAQDVSDALQELDQ